MKTQHTRGPWRIEKRPDAKVYGQIELGKMKKAGRLWSKKPYVFYWVAQLPGEEGVDWGYVTDSSKAKLLTPYWQRRFAAYCRRVNSEAEFI